MILAAPTPCPGVAVVVDPGPLGGQVRVGCAPGDPASGRDALVQAGFAPVTDVPGHPGLVCQVAGLPDPCNGAPATAYWSYWQLQDGQWVYSRSGADYLDPAPGSTQGWAFGAGNPPRTVPASRTATPPRTPSPGAQPPGAASPGAQAPSTPVPSASPSSAPAQPAGSSGSPLLPLLGAAVVLVLAAAALLRSRRRDRP